MTKDPFISSHVLASTPEPQKLVWLAMHQDYSSDPVYRSPLVNELERTEEWYGQKIIEHLLAGDRGHFGCFEHPQITVNCCYYPHSVMQQARTHRVGVSFDVQSFRYTSNSILSIKTTEDLERAIYFRPTGVYTDRHGKNYEYTQEHRWEDLGSALASVGFYQERIAQGYSEEHARGMLPFDYRQHFVVSFNARSLMHFLDLRGKKDSQLEIQWLANDLFGIFQQWMPETATWYESKRLGRARLAP